MQKLRSIHLYLGCVFAPLLLFFAVSGIWQTLGLRSPKLDWLASIHTAARFKNGHEPGSPALKVFVILMAGGFIVTTVLGVVMALNYGRSRQAAAGALALGVIIPVALVVVRIYG